MVRLFSALALACALAVPAAAQTASLSGSVVDQSGAAVPGASVSLVATSGAPAAATTTDAAGRFTLTGIGPGAYRVIVALTGFSTAVVPDVQVGGTNVEIPPVSLAVGSLSDTVVVSASRSDAPLAEAPATMSVVTSQQIESTPAQNYGDLLRSVPGANVIQLSARDVNVTSRQGTSTLSNSQLVLLDDRSLYLDFFGIVLWDFMPANLSDIKQIEVIRGPASAVWGANALTGVVNVITKTPREAPGTTVSFSAGGFSRNAGSTAGQGLGGMFGANATVARAPNATFSYRISAGYFNSDPLPRPTGAIPVIADPRDPKALVGGAAYPDDAAGALGSAFRNTGTSQPKFDVRVDQELDGGSVTYQGGVAGTAGIIHTGIGPFDIQKGAYQGYAKLNYRRRGFKFNVFTNITSADAPNLLLPDPVTRLPLQLSFATETYDVEIGDSRPAGARQVFTYGGNLRRNNFEITIAPAAENRTELGAYLQDEIFFDRVRLTLGARVDKFGNLDDPVFSPRLAAIFEPSAGQSIRLSFNRAFRSPSVINNYLDIAIVNPVDLRALAPLLPAPLRPAVAAPFPLVVKGVGSRVPINGQAQTALTEESMTAYEVAYSGTIDGRTTLGAAFYVNDLDHSINFAQLPAKLDPYTALNPPPGWPLPGAVVGQMAALGIYLPRTAFTYLNLGPLRQKGVELSVDHRVNRSLTAFANYSWQAKPTILDAPAPYPAVELALPPTSRFNVGFNLDGARFLGAASVNYSDGAFWSDVLTSAYHGFTDRYTLVNGSAGVKWGGGNVTTLLKVNNLFNEKVQQHVFGDLITRSVVAEVRLKID
ncbi:MAG: TonB-dependent receptor [Acidobacteria bacterium]|nr:TonB-dependent receptor [Acidobacteriota bacterium]